ncbi:Secretion-regulating guanine nucleotide exchange factor [Bagarius yarrelli]|uniref:Secretion-regulating guanine nucleotide exchange factor n=1 Tax=Bagarius yarrelli TaxID=175774 RepID=A0A556THX8_BAGYA|nr:Secretion-regulating guanine nucleotide exchange factor [Bagarius yarrelli]
MRQTNQMERSTVKYTLYTWGANSFGQLGLRNAEDQVKPQGVEYEQETETLRAVTGGGGHSALITESGKLLVCGQNHKGQLGLGHVAEVMTFQLCQLPGSRRVQQVSCGWDFTIILTVDDGEVLACGSNSFGQLGVSPQTPHSTQPLLISSFKEPVVSVTAGLRHALAVTDSGGVYQWGTGLLSQARRALNPHPVPAHLSSKEPCLVPGLDQAYAKSVSAGFVHCACLTVSGEVFLWGSNKHGQLCRNETFLPLPTVLELSLLNGEKVSAIHSGWTHLIAQTESKSVFTWGRASYGQLGRQVTVNDGTASTVPSEVRTLHGATRIACGSEHNLAIVGNKVFSWGWNEHGMCGDGSLCDVLQPQPIPDLQNAKGLLIGCGAGHSLALCLRNRKDAGS